MLQSKNGNARFKPYQVLVGLFLMALPIIPAQAQYTEIGLSLGGMHYTGDLVRTFRPSTIRPGASIFYRQNFSEAVSGRISLGGGFLHGNDNYPIDAFAEMREARFNTFLFQGDVAIEYHFLDYKSERAVANFSPYIALGVGLFYFEGNGYAQEGFSQIQPVLPIGLGMKFLLSPRITLGVEYSARKTFTDYIDGISVDNMNIKNYKYGNWYDNDWHYYLGISFSYSFYTIPCPYKWK